MKYVVLGKKKKSVVECITEIKVNRILTYMHILLNDDYPARIL